MVVVAAGFGGAFGSPTASGPLALSSGTCGVDSSCAFDYALDPSATSDPADSWHGLWVSTATSKVPSGWCELDAIATLTWSDTGPAGTTPAATYPLAGSHLYGARTAASLVVDAGGEAATPGRLLGRGMPAGVVTTWVHRGYLAVLWQGRARIDPSIVMAAAVPNPNPGAVSPPPRANDYSAGLPCSDFAPPGTTFLARFAHSTIHAGQSAYLQLRIPDTGLRWTITPALDEQSSVDGVATVQLIGGLGGLTTHSKPQTLHFADRWTLETKPGFGVWTAIVTLKGPTGIRHYKVPLTVRA